MNPDRSKYSKAFNTHFFQFLDDVLTIYPENEEIASGRRSFDLIKRANPTAIIKVWYTHIYLPYHSIIESGNLDYFFDKDYGEDLSTTANAKEIIGMIDRIRGPIKSMDETNKNHSIKYIQNLTKLSVMYNDA